MKFLLIAINMNVNILFEMFLTNVIYGIRQETLYLMEIVRFCVNHDVPIAQRMTRTEKQDD